MQLPNVWRQLESESKSDGSFNKQMEDFMAFKHTSVLLEETVDGLAVKPDGIYVDATLGGGGHAYEVCKRLNSKGSFIGIPVDLPGIRQ